MASFLGQPVIEIEISSCANLFLQHAVVQMKAITLEGFEGAGFFHFTPGLSALYSHSPAPLSLDALSPWQSVSAGISIMDSGPTGNMRLTAPDCNGQSGLRRGACTDPERHRFSLP